LIGTELQLANHPRRWHRLQRCRSYGLRRRQV